MKYRGQDRPVFRLQLTRRTWRLCVYLLLTCVIFMFLRHFIQMEKENPQLLHHQRRRVFNQVMTGRRERIERVCKDKRLSRKLNERRRLHYHMYVLENQDLAWCPVHKAASSSWLINMLLINGVRDYELDWLSSHMSELQEMGRESIPVMTKNIFAEYMSSSNVTSVLIVRHPFSRLLSAYREKLEIMDHTYHRQYGSIILQRHRKQYIDIFGEEELKEENNFGSPYNVKGRTQDNPTWWEFVNYIIDTVTKGENLDPLWAPMVDTCEPCAISYDLIIHFESFQEEEMHVLEIIQQNQIKARWKSRKDVKYPSLEHKNDIVRAYMNLLNPEQIRKLAGVYRMDFEMFGYYESSYI